jgi:hypothetical protein
MIFLPIDELKMGKSESLKSRILAKSCAGPTLPILSPLSITSLLCAKYCFPRKKGICKTQNANQNIQQYLSRANVEAAAYYDKGQSHRL